MKTRCSNVIRFLPQPAWLGNTLPRLASSVVLAAAVFAAPLQAQVVFDATADFSITNGNPNGAWSYGWMPTDFSTFNLHTNATTNVNGDSPGWGDVTGFWKNLGSAAYGVPTGWLSLHPGPGEEPSVVRWTSPLLGSARIQGRFLAGDSGSMLVAVRMNGQAVWQATDSGAFDLLRSVVAGDTVDFAVYGGYWAGNTPLEATIALTLPNSICLRQSSYTVAENANVASVAVLRSGPEHLDEEVTVDYATVDVTAHAGEDYVAASGTLHFAAGETNKQIAITILDDALAEREEQFRLVLSNPTGGVSLANSNAVIRIQDNDPGVRFMTENVAVSEAVGVVTIAVQRGDHHDLNLPFTVDYATVAGTAHAGEDYVAASGTLQFAAGETNKLITITILGDALQEPWEQFGLVLSNPTGGVSLDNPNVVIWIQNDVPTTYYVNVNNPNPVFPYTNWATAATNIQDAVDVTKAGDTVLVTNGVYAVGGRGGNRVSITNSIRLESVNGPSVTTIEGGLPRRDENGYIIDARRCVYLGTNAVLSGFTLTNGHAYFQNGGGVFSEPSGVVTNCVLTGNLSFKFYVSPGGYGGGACGGNLYNCTLTNNTAEHVWFSTGYYGGGGAAGCILYNCTVTGNSGSGAEGCTLYNCTLTGNSAHSGGGANGCTLYNCTLTGNTASDGGGGASDSMLYNCLVTDNDGGSDGQFFNCTVVGNNGGVSGTVFNSIIYYNFGGNYAAGTVLNFSCTTPLPTNGVGNITGHPLFMDMAAGDYRLSEVSPCIDAGTNLIAMNVGYTYDPTDILGNTRFIDGNFDGRVAWDIGAYEFNSYPPPRFTSGPRLTASGWRLNITGAPNKWVRVQRSSDLKNWEDFLWPPYIFMGSEGVKQVDDGDTSQKAMFYRAVVE